ncbi:hypothetical protein M23134_02365 [Microscilla marina ATCC 23134]|uniref:Uncharacterized protein n=1 Tax=Microscilla marina ATCC 23134 TaxID=313606 RepID=A1ZKE8_MICM2|nr:hypothetical protein M23134_02365 [Microscilla marina ATCC 23134]
MWKNGAVRQGIKNEHSHNPITDAYFEQGTNFKFCQCLNN